MIDQEIFEDDFSKPALPEQRRRLPWPLFVVAALFVIVSFLSWYGSWFGRSLSDSQLESYLSDTEKPRHVQHALSQIADRIINGDQAVKQFYPAVISAAKNPTPQVRLTSAWTMGQDNTSQEFHSALLPMLQDESAGVRHNAALALVRFGDASGRPELVSMLKPITVRAEEGGTVEMILEQEGTPVAAGSPLARITLDDGRVMVVRIPEDGRIDLVKSNDGARVEAGADLAVISPGVQQVENTLLALALIGQSEDIPFIERYTREIAGMPDHIRQKAAASIEEIRNRATH